ncbi:MAG: hypothetical protein ACTHM1_00100 [Solirubrobacteraceae bacterium]
MARENLLSTIRSEIEERLSALRPALAEHEQLLGALSALDVSTGLPSGEGSASAGVAAGGRRPRRSTAGTRKSSRSAGAKRARAPRGAAREAILAALGHGSHTVSELVVVTAMTGPNINGNLRRLLSEGAITKTDREGKTAYALSD